MWTSRIAHFRSISFYNNYISRTTPLHVPLLHISNRGLSGSGKRINQNKPFSHKFHNMFEFYASRILRYFAWSPLLRVKWRSQSESQLGQLVYDFGRSFSGKGRDMLLSAACLSVYKWDNDSVPDCQISEYVNDIDYIHKLTIETVTCKLCLKRLKIDQKLPEVDYCTCPDGKAPNDHMEGWKPFIERPNTLVWRKEHDNYKGMFAYKMYVRLDRVTAVDFLRVQLDTEFRKQWDTSATELKIIEESPERNSDLVYWRTQWPKPFANRDYVFLRRLTFDPAARVCIISSVATTHPDVPAFKSMHRVTEYWSFMVVRPFTDFNKAGLEFVLTYFDNPGLSIPSAVSTWVAMTGLPNFVGKLQEAAGRVAGLNGAEPALLRRLREQLESSNQNVISGENPERETRVHQNETSSDGRGGQRPDEEGPPGSDSETHKVDEVAGGPDSISQESGSSFRSHEAASTPVPEAHITSVIVPPPAASCSDSVQQFLPGSHPVYA